MVCEIVSEIVSKIVSEKVSKQRRIQAMKKKESIQKAIMDEVKGIDNEIILEKVLEVVHLYRIGYSETEYKSMKKVEYQKMFAISEILMCDNSKARDLELVRRFARRIIGNRQQA